MAIEKSAIDRWIDRSLRCMLILFQKYSAAKTQQPAANEICASLHRARAARNIAKPDAIIASRHHMANSL